MDRAVKLEPIIDPEATIPLEDYFNRGNNSTGEAARFSALAVSSLPVQFPLKNIRKFTVLFDS